MEKLEIEPDKIIHILLKHLMHLKNKIAFLENDAALNSFDKDIQEKKLGINKLYDGKPKDDLGIKHILEALPELKADKIGVDLIYTVFEKGLLNALEQYIKNGDGQTTVYNFYTDFVEAVE